MRSASDPQSAEIAVAVVDEWQHRGLGTVLLDRLVKRAREEGIGRVTALILADNEDMLDLLHRLGGTTTRVSDGLAEVSVGLPEEAGAGALLRELLRAVGRGDLEALRQALSERRAP